MNQLLTFAVVIALAMSGRAEAASKKKTKHNKAKTVHSVSTTKKRSKKLTAAQIKQANTAAAAAVDAVAKRKVFAAAQVAPAAPAATTTTQVAAPVAKSTKAKFGFNWLSLNGIGMKPIQGNPTDGKLVEVSAWEQPTVKYNFNDNISFGVMPQFFHTWFGDTQQPQDIAPGQLSQGAAFNMGNTALKLTHSKIAEFGKGFKIDGQLRFDIPTSEVAQKNDEIGETWIIGGLSKSVGKFDLKATGIARIYHQQYNTSRLVDSKNNGLQNNAFRHYQYVDIGYNFTEKLGLTLELGSYVTYYHADPDTNRPQKISMKRIANLGLGYNFSKNFSLSVGISDVASSITETRLPFDITNDGDGGEAYLAASFTI